MKLAIQGHQTRGKEIIELLEMLGGNVGKKILSTANIGDILNPHIYFFDSDSSDNRIVWYYLLGLKADGRASEMMIFTLEEFEQKFPYKVGDKVIAYTEGCLAQFTIQDMRWNYKLNRVEYKICSSWCDTSLMQPYKEEVIEENANKAIFEGNAQSCDIMNDIIKKAMERIKIDIPEGYKFDCIDNNNKIVLTKIQPQYPKTYVECAKILDCFSAAHIDGYKNELFEKLQELYICRNAYWKIAGEEMGLDKPWEPDWNDGELKWCMSYSGNCIEFDQYKSKHHILAFPTKEMRDAFYENFKDLIEGCKELV